MAETTIAFLDRDGVINWDEGYTYVFHPDIVFPDIEHLLHLALDQVFIVTNQAGIGRGYYTEADFHLFMSQLARHLEREFGLTVTDYFFCPHVPPRAPDVAKCACRKPAPGMFLEAQALYGVDFSKAFMVGDKISDVQASHAAGIRRNYLLNRPENNARRVSDGIDSARYAVREITSLRDIVAWD